MTTAATIFRALPNGILPGSCTERPHETVKDSEFEARFPQDFHSWVRGTRYQCSHISLSVRTAINIRRRSAQA